MSFSETVIGIGFSHHPHFTAFEKQKRTTILIGYARVSTPDQNLALQYQTLSAAGCEKIFDDTISGTKIDRPSLTKVQEQLRPGDTLVIWKLDRLGRTVKNLIDFSRSRSEVIGCSQRSPTTRAWCLFRFVN